MKTHDLKIMPEFYNEVLSGKKKFELRLDDRNFTVGDILNLKEWSNGNYTGRSSEYSVDYILKGFNGLESDYVIMSISPYQHT